MQEFTVNIDKKTQVADNVFEIQTQKPGDFSFQAGQFVQWFVPQGDENPVMRSYSLSSTPHDDHIEFCIKLIAGGKASNMIEQAKVGDTLKFRGPNGRFVNNETANHLSFIATGTGLAPIIGIIRDELKHKQNKNNIHLLFGVRETKDIFWETELQSLAAQYSNFTCDITLSQEQTDKYKSGRVTSHITAKPQTNYFICGSREMVLDARKLLINQDIPAPQLHFEIF